MLSKISLKWSWFTVSIVGITCFLIIVLFLTLGLSSRVYVYSYTGPVLPIDQKSVESIEGGVFTEQANSGLPVRLKIPKINVDTALEQVGLTAQGAVDVPKTSTNAAWFDLGPRPGDSGSAVITGHYGIWKNGDKSVFDDLNKLRKGDILYIEDSKGATTAFVVRASRSYDPSAVASEVFISSDGKAHLNLITCAGAWNKSVKQYSKRLVVFADKETE